VKHPSFLIAFFSTIVRYYDYALFGLSASILSKNFLPNFSEDKQLLGFFAIFSLAVVTRPIGSIIFGWIGDSFGRIKAIKIAAILAAISTSFIGITPGFNMIGWTAVVILTFCRMVFLISLAGEVDTIRIYAAEKVGKSHKNSVNGMVSFFSQIGALLAATSYYFLSDSEYLWRISFVGGGIMGIIVIFLREHFIETAEFLTYKANNSDNKNLLQAIKDHQQQFIIATIISGSIGGIYHFSIIFFATFISKVTLQIDQDQAGTTNIMLIIIYAISALFSGIIADRTVAMKQIYFAIIASIMVLIISIFTDLLIYSPLIIVVLLPLYSVPLQVKIQSLFNVGIRARMCSLSHSIGGIIISSSTPLISMVVWEYTKSLTCIFIVVVILLFALFGAVVKIPKQAS